MGGAVAVSAKLWDVSPRRHDATGRGREDPVVASDKAAPCFRGTETGSPLPPPPACASALTCRGGWKSPSEPERCQSQHLGFQPSDFLDHKIDVNNRVEVQGPVKQAVADKLRNEGPEHGHEQPLC